MLRDSVIILVIREPMLECRKMFGFGGSIRVCNPSDLEGLSPF